VKGVARMKKKDKRSMTKPSKDDKPEKKKSLLEQMDEELGIKEVPPPKDTVTVIFKK